MWKNYGIWHSKVYKHPSIKECEILLKEYLVRTIGKISQPPKVICIEQEAWSNDFVITYMLGSSDIKYTVKSSELKQLVK
jgi:hypothetical protein